MKKTIIISAIFVVILIVGLLVYLTFYKTAAKDFTISIKQGDSTSKIAQNLKNEKAIFSPLIFTLYVYQRHWYLQSGVYKIKSDMTMPQIIKTLKNGDVQEYLVTIPEGWRLTQIDDELTQRGIIKKGDLIKIASSDEGYLFPDTYRLPLNITVGEIRDEMIRNFNLKTAEFKTTRGALIIASLVEREAKFDEDRPIIAGVYWNRLKIGMKLEADPTVQYAKGSWDAITSADYHNVDSPYNTYLYAGLPPGPICNPGIKSIQAAMFPEKNDWLFFFHKDDGHAVYSKTFEEHQSNLKKY